MAEAKLAVSNGAHAIGLVSQMHSGSGFMIDDISEIVTETPPPTSTVLLTSEDDLAKIIEHQRTTRANTLQLIGPILPESVLELREALPDVSLTRGVSVVDSTAIEEALSFSTVADALLLDSKVAHCQGGGTGLTHDWSVSHRIVDASPLRGWTLSGQCC
ncbi:MAG: phosphoribosylanthranilate isomerase [Verrucomicrobiaceae bacterium]|nr:phosphoribosylanthranilate isomerase [Verrucomicrobiaceae bacterium]